MAELETLTDFLRSTDASFRIFDMGRRLSKLDLDRFQHFEKTQIPYPYPLMRQAWLGIIIWNPKQQNQQQIWFLRFPLDEQGKLILAGRDDFLNRLAQTVGNQLLDECEDENHDPLKDNPFSFTPDPQRMAAFHAQATRLLKQPASNFYTATRTYLQGDDEQLQQWHSLGLQGIADLCARLDESNNTELLLNALEKMPAEPYIAFCSQLEHVQIPYPLAGKINHLIEQRLQDENPTSFLTASIRALAQSTDQQHRKQALSTILALDSSQDIELLAAIGSRCWEDLQDADLGLSYIQRLAENNAGQASFALMLQDLLYLPGMREPIMSTLRNPERGEAVSRAVGDFFGGGQA